MARESQSRALFGLGKERVRRFYSGALLAPGLINRAQPKEGFFVAKTRVDMPVEELATWVAYDPGTGSFTWKDSGQWRWNFRDRYVGKPAGSVHKGNRNLTPYLYITIKRAHYLAHRVAWALTTGAWPEGHIDHIDGNGLNNVWDNLREETVSENHKNSPKQRNNTSGVTGVSFSKAQNKWQAYIHKTGRKMVHLGYFVDMEQAVKARKAAELEYGYHENHGR